MNRSTRLTRWKVVTALGTALAVSTGTVYSIRVNAAGPQTAPPAFGLCRSAIDKNSAENAKDYLIRARDQLATTITYWRDRKNEDAVGILREPLKKMDALDAAMSADTTAQKAIASLAASVGSSCQSCHAKYREQDPATKEYRVKADKGL